MYWVVVISLGLELEEFGLQNMILTFFFLFSFQNVSFVILDIKLKDIFLENLISIRGKI